MAPAEVYGAKGNLRVSWITERLELFCKVAPLAPPLVPQVESSIHRSPREILKVK
jgi:hypothetical protein